MRLTPLSLTLLFALGLVAGCGDDDRGPASDTCEYGGVTYQAGDTFPSTDGCNTCSCNSESGTKVSCSVKTCRAQPPVMLTAEHCPSLADWVLKELPHEPAGDAVCAAEDAPVCSTSQGTPGLDCPMTCYCTCYQRRCYLNGCSGPACDDVAYQAD